MATNHSPIDEFFGTIDDEEREGEATVPYSGLSGEVVAFISFFPFTCLVSAKKTDTLKNCLHGLQFGRGL